MTRKRVLLILALIVLVAAIAGTAAAASNGVGAVPSASASAAEDDEASDDDAPGEVDEPGDVDVPITGPDLERASAVALDYAREHFGEGTVTDTEVGDEESYYEVEVTLADGRQIDVQLDEAFNVVGLD